MKAQTEKTKSAFRSADLSERAIQRRAVEAFIWGRLFWSVTLYDCRHPRAHPERAVGAVYDRATFANE